MTLFSGMRGIQSITEKCVAEEGNAETVDFQCVFKEKVRNADAVSNRRLEKNCTPGNLKNYARGLHLTFEGSTFLTGSMVAGVPRRNSTVPHMRLGFLKGGFTYNAASGGFTSNALSADRICAFYPAMHRAGNVPADRMRGISITERLEDPY